MLSRTSRFGRGLLAVTAAVAIAACDAATDVAGPEAHPNEQDLRLADLVGVGGDNQEASVGATAPEPLVVRVVSEDGSPIPNAPVEWTFVQGRGQSPQLGSPRQVLVVDTDAEGLSTVEWQLGTQAGVQSASAAIVVSDAVLSGTAPATAPPSDRGKKVGFEAKVKPGSVDDISLDPEAVTAEPGDSMAIDAVVKDQYGNEIEGASLTWSSSDANVAEVDAEGVVRVLDVGTSQVSAKSGSVEGVATVTSVDDSPQPATVVVRPDDVTLQVGDTVRLDATILDTEGAEINGAEIAWITSDGSVLSVESNGLVTALGVGTAVVRAAVDDVSGEEAVVVEGAVVDVPESVGDLAVTAPSETSLTLRWTEVADGTGEPASYAIRMGSPSISWGEAYGTERTIAGNDVGAVQELEWTGLESATTYEFQIVAYRGTLNETAVFGSVSAAVAGETDGSPEPEELTVVASPEQVRLAAVGDTATLSVHAEDGVGEVVEDVTFQFSSSDPTTVEVDMMGRITARGLGAAVITVTTLCCGGSELVGVEVGNIDDIVITQDGVPFTDDQISLDVGQSTTFEIEAVDSTGASLGQINPEWDSSDPSVATVSGGTVIAVGEGDADITATYEGYTASLGARVRDEIVFEPGEYHEPAGLSQIFHADGTTKDFQGNSSHLASAEYVYVVPDAGSPSGSAVEWRWPLGAGTGVGFENGNDGNSAFYVSEYDGSNAAAAVGPQREIYYRMVMKYGPEWDAHPNGDKLMFFGHVDKSSSYFLQLRPPAGEASNDSAPRRVGFQNQASGGGSPSFFWVNGEEEDGWLEVRNRYVVFEVYMVAQSTPSASDGEFHMWIDGTKVEVRTDMQYVTSGDVRFEGFEWYPYWGGANGPTKEVAPYDWLRFAELYVSGQP